MHTSVPLAWCRPPILATIELVDGTIISDELPVTPDLNVGKVRGGADCRDDMMACDPEGRGHRGERSQSEKSVV